MDTEVNCEETAIEFFLTAFMVYINEHVKAEDLMAYYELYTSAQRKSIRRLTRDKPNEAVQKSFEIIADEITNPHKYKYLKEALEEAGYPKIVTIITGRSIPVNETNKKHIQKLTPMILDHLKVVDILPYLRAKSVLEDRDVIEIQATLTQKGDWNAGLDLLIILANRSTSWYPCFIQALMDSNHVSLAKKIDGECCAKIEHQKVLGDAGDIEPLNDNASVMTLSLRANTDATTDSCTSMMEISVVDPADGTSNMVKQDVMYDRCTTPESSINNLDAPPHTTPIISEMASFEMKLSSLMGGVDINKDTAMQSKGEAAPAQPKQWRFSKPKTMVPQLDCDNFQEFQLLQKRAKSPEVEAEKQEMRENSPSPVTKEIGDKDIGRADMQEKLDNFPPNITEYEAEAFSDEDENIDEDEDITLRKYQTELAAEAIRGKNVIIVAPTGSGKTRVALKIMQEHIRKWKGRGIAKVAFLANQVALANQQGEECAKLLKKYKSKVISGETQRTRSECLKDFLDKRDILVITPQVLLDSLVRKEISSITKFSLLVFDECHHTHANHTFNQIMSTYMDLKLSSKDPSILPQIVGLTASVGVGKAKNKEKAVEHITSLMANLDAEKICTVQNNMTELRDFVSIPEEETCTVPGRQNDVFGEGVTRAVMRIENLMSTDPAVVGIREWAEFEKTLKPPAQKGTVQYTQWISRLWKETAKLRDQAARRFLNPCRSHLENYNNSLIIYNDARVEDALSYLEGAMKKWKEGLIMDNNEERLYKIYEALLQLPFKECSTNPKLDKLQQLIMKAYRGEEKLENSRGIIFVKTRDLATAIVSWMMATPEIKKLNPIKFVGQNMSADKGGMTKVEQVDTLKYFRNGKHKLIVATSVAEEGLDISKCNLVIRYDHVTNEIAMVQSRGRGRAQDSKYVVLAEEGTGMAEKEELNMIREILMRKAIIHLQERIMQDPIRFKSERNRLQEKAKVDRDLASISRKGRRIRQGEFELRCQKCDTYVTMSSDIKRIEMAHHVVIDETLQDRVNFKRHPEPQQLSRMTQQAGKLHCMGCGDSLGGLITHKGLEFPVLSIKNFLVMDMNGRQDTCRQWKNAPFYVKDLTTDDFRDMLRAKTIWSGYIIHINVAVTGEMGLMGFVTNVAPYLSNIIQRMLENC